MSDLIDRERFSADMRDFQNRVGIWRDEAEDTETRTRADAALATIIETKLILDKQPTVAAASPWHGVEAELPEIGKIVLVYDDWDRLSICKLDNQYRWLRQGGGWFDVPYVRYWMPIEPPKEDA